MSGGRSKLYDSGAVAERGDVAASAVDRRKDAVPRTLRQARSEIDTLRSINGHLIQQVAALKQREAQAQSLADRDGLTGLYNRRKMMELLECTLADAAPLRRRVGLLFIDLDGFKTVNDVHGHSMGDKLLTTVASRIAARARTGDFVCRYGGDEFVVILPQTANLSSVRQVADAIRKRVALPYRIDGVELQLTAAIGIAMFPELAGSAVELLNLADESMYRAKSRWTDPLEMLDGLPARRHDDRTKRRTLS